MSTTSVGSTDTSSSAQGDSSDGVPPTDVAGPPIDGCADYDAFAAALVDADPASRTDVTAAFVDATMRSEHGFPIRCEGRLIALLWDESEGTVSLTGEFAQWDPSAYPLQPLVDGFALQVADVAVTEPMAGSIYKFVRDGETYFADPWARRYAWDEFGEFSLTDARPEASHHERYLGFAEGIGELQPRTIVVYVPAGELAGDPELAVLYMHDGQNLFAPDAFFGGWQVGAAIDAAIAAGEVAPMLVVGIDNTSDRFDEYTPTLDDLGSGPVGGRADEYADFIALGLKPFIDAQYPTRTGPEATAVLGSSLGGLASLYIAWRYPEVFGFAGSMSGTLDWGQMGADNDRILELYEQQPPVGVWIYLDSGGDGPCPDDTDNYCVNVQMRELLGTLGWNEPEDLEYVHEPNAPHNEAAWAGRLPGFLGAWGEVG